MTLNQINLLNRGLKFTPTPVTNNIELKKDLHEFTRKLRLLEFHKDKEENNQNQENSQTPLIKDKSRFNPPQNQNKFLDTSCKFLLNQNIDNENNRKIKYNLSKDEWKALKELQQDKNIIIKEADKGGAVVIMNVQHYESMVYEQLNDEKTYLKATSNIDQKTMTQYIKLINKYNSIIKKEEKVYLTSFNYVTSQFYGQPKIHKSKIINEAIISQNNTYIQVIEPKDLKLRPIVAGHNCPTKRLSNFLDILLKPFLCKVKSYVRDDIDFIIKCRRTCNSNTNLVSFDVKSLYTSIPHELGVTAIKYWLNKHPELLHQRFNKDFVIEALLFVLKNNNFLFNNEYFHQLTGTAMGTIVAPTYATLVMAYIEMKMYELCELKYGKITKDIIEEEWSRFLDDCFIALDSNIIKPNELLNLINSIDKHIQFTMEISETKLPFLDILINKNENNEIWMDIFYKETDTRKCVPLNSSHPKHCLKNIPFTLARRMCSIVENNKIKQNRLKDLYEILQNQAYPENLISSGIQRALEIPQNELRKVKEKSNDKIIAFVTTFNPNNQNIYPTIQNTFTSLQQHDDTKEAFENYKLIRSYRQPPNLKRLLSKARYSAEEDSFTTSTCKDPRCKCCQHLIIASEYKFKNQTDYFKIKSNFNCDSHNLIYVVICPTCNEEYIGETGEGKSKLRDRVRTYRQHIRQPELAVLKVENHLRECGNENFKIFPFFQLKDNNKKLREQYEFHFRKKFKPSLH